MVHEPASFKLGKMIDTTESSKVVISVVMTEIFVNGHRCMTQARTSEIILLLSCHSVQVHSGDSHSIQVQSGDSHSIQVQSGDVSLNPGTIW